MNASAFSLTLGAGLAATVGVGNKAALLDRAASAGLGVPRGIVLLHAAWQHAVAAGLVSLHQGVLRVVDAPRLYALLELPDLSGPVAVRSAFSAEDGPDTSRPGWFGSQLWVKADDAQQVTAALCQVWSSALEGPEVLRRDVLIMRMVDAQHAGVAFTEQAFEDDVVNVAPGTAERLVSGNVPGASLELPKLRRWERRDSHGCPAAWAGRLQRLLRDVRRVFGAADWDIEWADDGRRCWLVQLRPITRPIRRNEAFTTANFKEILPPVPSRFMSSLIASCADALFAYYRTYDADLPANRQLIEVWYGRPVFNVSLLRDMMRSWGLPTRLVTQGIGGDEGRPYGFNVGRLLRKAPVLFRFGLAQLRSEAAARRTMRRMLTGTDQPGATLTACIETLRWLYIILVMEMLSLTAAMSLPLYGLRRLGVLTEHNARQQTVATAMFTELEPLRQIARRQLEVRAALQQGHLPVDATFRRLWQAYVTRHGHRGIYESDIARPRLHEAPQPVLTSLTHTMSAQPGLPRRTLLGWLTWPLWWHASRVMRAREDLRYHAMIGFDRIRQALLVRAVDLAVAGVLPAPEALWKLNVEEAQRLEAGWRPGSDFFAQRQQKIERDAAVQLPDHFQRFDDLETAGERLSGSTGAQRFSGVSLTAGLVEGQAWVLTEPQSVLPPGYEPETTILVTRSVDAGWIPTFGTVAGVVVETGGDLSHGSIILREIGLPAITNVGQVVQCIRTGERLRLRADVGVVERL